MRRLVVLALGVLAMIVVPALPASAHPLGNFTVNRYDGVLVGPQQTAVDHVLDLAEIPTVQVRGAIDADGDGDFSAAELTAWARGRCADERSRLSLELAGRSAPLVVTDATARSLPGQAGLPTLRVQCALRAVTRVSGDATPVTFADRGTEQVGWREITVRGDAVTVGGTSDTRVRTTSPSKRLTAYPGDLLTSPLDERSVTFTATPGGARADTDPGAEDVLPRPTDRLGAAFTSLVGQRSLGLGAALLAVGLALLIGAMHAVAPGHGKTIMAFYLVGRGETNKRAVRGALTVGTTVTLTHTAGVLVLGLVIASTASATPVSAYPWLGAASGIVIAAVGAGLLRHALRRRRTGEHPHTHPHSQHHGPSGHSHPHAHPHPDEQPHAHAHPHPDEQPHAHAHPHLAGPQRVAAASRVVTSSVVSSTLVADDDRAQQHTDTPQARPHAVHDVVAEGADDGVVPDRRGRAGLVAVGIAGGLVPSPSALVVLLGAAAVGRAWFGVVLVVAFGLGMAATLSVTGLLLVAAQDRVARVARVGRIARPGWLWPARTPWMHGVIPLVSATAVCLLGLYLVVRGLTALP